MPTTDETSPTATRESRDSLLIVAISGMHSHACEEAVVSGLEAVGGVREAEVDFPSGQASVIYDARTVAAHTLMEAVEEAGYRCGEYHLGGSVAGVDGHRAQSSDSA